MEEVTIRAFEEAGVDVSEAMHRFLNNEDLFVKFMTKFKEDTNFEMLKNYVDNGNVEDAFKAAHSLKGVVSNLAFKDFLEVLVPVVESLRAGTLEGVPEGLARVQIAYDKVVSAIDTLG